MFSNRAYLVVYKERWKQSEQWTRYGPFIMDRHGFIKLKKSTLLIQQVARNWITQRCQSRSIVTSDVSAPDLVNASIVIQKYLHGWLARSRCTREVVQIEKPSCLPQEKGAGDLQMGSAFKIHFALKNSICCNSLQNQHLAVTEIQSHFRGWLLRRRFQTQRQAILKIQSTFRMSRCLKAYQQYRILIKSAIIIQSFVRQWIWHKEACRRMHLIVTIQVNSPLSSILC